MQQNFYIYLCFEKEYIYSFTNNYIYLQKDWEVQTEDLWNSVSVLYFSGFQNLM